MTLPRLECLVALSGDGEFPDDDEHPFYSALEDFSEAIADSLKERGADLDEIARAEATEDGSMLTISSNTPRSMMHFWVYLAEDSQTQAALLPVLLEHLARMREALPEATFDVTLNKVPLVWEAGRFHMPA
jgi:hypothetical protein